MKKKFLKFIVSALLMCVFVIGFASCGKDRESRQTYTGSYYITQEINGVQRGCDILVILNSDNSIYTISEDEESEYILYDQEQLWGIFSNLNFYPNLCTAGVEEIQSWEVVKGDDGLPTEIKGMPTDWLVAANTGACGMVVLALQDAFSKIK
jgi:hypothetical protein